MAMYENRICKQCKNKFVGGPNALYCPSCSKKRKSERDRENKRKEIRGLSRKIGSEDICKKCGRKYTVTTGNQIYCKNCGEEMQKQRTIQYNKKIQQNKKNENTEKKKSRAKSKELKTSDRIKDLRQNAKMSVKEFSEYFKIPKPTIYNWESKKGKAPEYVIELIEYKLKKEKKIKKEKSD